MIFFRSNEVSPLPKISTRFPLYPRTALALRRGMPLQSGLEEKLTALSAFFLTLTKTKIRP